MDDFQARTDRFLKWFKDSGGVFRDDLLEIKDLRSKDAGRGIIAIKDIPQDTKLFTIPRDIIINVQTSELAKKLPQVFDESMNDDDDDDDDDDDEELEPLDSWASLILVMLYEYLQGDASRWKSYIDILPQTFDTPIFWSKAELKELDGTCLTTEKIGKEESDDMLRTRILPIVLQNAGIFFPEGTAQLGEEDLMTLAHRMGSTIMAYAFDLENETEGSDDEEEGWVEDREGKTLLGMVPMADILNANAEFNAHVNHGDSLEVTALRSTLPTGSEVLNYYGALPSSELLRRYGYVTVEHHQHDVAELPWTLVRSALSEELGLSHDDWSAIESALDDPEDLEDYFIIERDPCEPSSEGQLLEPAKMSGLPPELEEQIKTILKAAKKCRAKVKNDKRKREEVSSNVIRKALTARLAQYPTTAEQDELILRQDISKRQRMAVEVRLGEKKLLQEALDLVQGNERSTQQDQERPGKKAKRDR